MLEQRGHYWPEYRDMRPRGDLADDNPDNARTLKCAKHIAPVGPSGTVDQGIAGCQIPAASSIV